ncbi:glycogen synthase [Shewanella holmiensis]|uniref:starch synthase n=1 Tax=Shewanella holmiensis TaxID=2952222 RepID=A0A9X2WLU9_9GAMM|nr:glycogen/starch synthase [Shewanella holmiensis]MCT7941752.1 glycogen/starch synthase [Shewanella holmiensis]
MKKVLLVAAENDALINAKVGGMGDVIRDLPVALNTCAVSADVAMPEYGFLKDYYAATKTAEVVVSYGNSTESVIIYKMLRPETKHVVVDADQLNADSNTTANQQQNWVYLFAHPLFNQVDGSIYTQGSADRPFADDANKFALFSLAVAQALLERKLGDYQVMHLHDWHSAMIAMLRAVVTEFAPLKTIKCVFTIHNLALQGIRPFSGEKSSFCHWFARWFSVDSLHQNQWLSKAILDPRYSSCVNPMRMGIVLSDTVHVVSPTYAKEILQQSEPQKGFVGGEGLEQDLQHKADQHQLVGIINGCSYAENSHANDKAIQVKQRLSLLNKAQDALIKWQAHKASVSSADFIASQRLQQNLIKLSAARKTANASLLITSVGRLTSQKVMLFLQKLTNGKSALSQILSDLYSHNPEAMMIILGSGDEFLSNQIKTIAAQHTNCLFLNGYDEALSDDLYQQGDLFLMPSSFEPCGISQMLAMKHGQPCLVHAVGGLKDTVLHQQNGWVFDGIDAAEQAKHFVEQFKVCLECDTETLANIKLAASQARFDWTNVALSYNEQLYSE